MTSYPAWAYFPRRSPAPDWVPAFLAAIATHKLDIDSATHDKLDSDDVVRALRDTLVLDGWQIEQGKRAEQKIHRPVLFGDNGTIRVKQEIDGWHPELGIVLEVESGRGWQGECRLSGSCEGLPHHRCPVPRPGGPFPVQVRGEQHGPE